VSRKGLNEAVGLFKLQSFDANKRTPSHPHSLRMNRLFVSLAFGACRRHLCSELPSLRSIVPLVSPSNRVPNGLCWLHLGLPLRHGGPIVSIPLAQTGEGIKECEVTQWFVRIGDQVEEFGKLCEVQSDKATVEVTSRYTGTIVKVHHDPGALVQVRC
jgi:Biotin-requiring enzyme